MYFYNGFGFIVFFYLGITEDPILMDPILFAKFFLFKIHESNIEKKRISFSKYDFTLSVVPLVMNKLR